MLGGYEQTHYSTMRRRPAGAFRYRRSAARPRRAARLRGLRARATAGIPARSRGDQAAGPSWRTADDDGRWGAHRRPGAGCARVVCGRRLLCRRPVDRTGDRRGTGGWIIDGTPPMDLSPLAPGREGSLSEEKLKTACRLHRAPLLGTRAARLAPSRDLIRPARPKCVPTQVSQPTVRKRSSSKMTAGRPDTGPLRRRHLAIIDALLIGSLIGQALFSRPGRS